MAFTSDIPAMFYHVKVPDNQINFLRYLWRNNNDLNGRIVVYEMRIRVFGGTSSPGCCNYALRRMQCTKLRHKVAETILHIFYVDDLLKSVESEEEAIQLIKDVSRMFGEGGFNLAKLIYNRKAIV